MREAIIRMYADRFIAFLMRGGEHYLEISDTSIETDGRKARKTCREYAEAGYLTPGANEARFTITSKAYDETEAEKPDLTPGLRSCRDEYAFENHIGMVFSSLLTKHKKWIVEHRADYRLLKGRPGKLEPWNGEATDYGQEIYVVDDEFDRTKAELLLSLRIEKAYSENLGWGLVTLGIIEEGDVDVFKPNSGLLLHCDSGLFSRDPEKWATNAEKGIESLRDRIAKAQRALNIMVRTEGKVQEMGGWPAVLGMYREKLVEEIKKQLAKKAEKSA